MALRRALAVVLVACLPLVATADGASAAVPVAVSSWPQFGRTPRHPNVNPTETAFTAQNVSSLATEWKGHYGRNTTTEGGTVVAGGVAYVTGFDGNLSAFAADGCGAESCEPLWQGHTHNDITGTPAVVGGVVYVGSADHYLYSFRATGCRAALCSPLWRGRLHGAVVDSSVAVDGGIAYIGDVTGRLYAFTAAGCGAAVCLPLWVGRGAEGEVFTAPAVGHGNVYVATAMFDPRRFTGRLLAFPAGGCGQAACQPSWEAELGGPSTLTASPTITDTHVYVGGLRRRPDGTSLSRVFAFAAGGCGASVCQPAMTFNAGDNGISATPAIVGSTLLVSTQSTPDPNTVGVVAAFDTSGCGVSVCDPLWTGVNFGFGFESSPSVAGGLVFVGKGPASGFPVDSGLYAYDIHGCGAVICMPLAFAQLGPSQFYLGAPLAIAGGRIFMASNDNTDGHSNLYALSVAG